MDIFGASNQALIRKLFSIWLQFSIVVNTVFKQCLRNNLGSQKLQTFIIYEFTSFEKTRGLKSDKSEKLVNLGDLKSTLFSFFK